MAGWIVKVSGPCSKCGATLFAGTEAIWDQRLRKMRHIECPIEAAPEPSPPPLDRGIGGRSARARFDRLSANRAARIDRNWGRFAGVVRALTTEPQSTRAWAVGAAGEEELARQLEDVEGLQVLNDRSVPRTRGNIDHIVIAPAGIFVVDAKNMRGLIQIRDVGPFWRSDSRLYVGGRDKSSLADNMTWQLDAVQTALIEADISRVPPITPVLCFVNGEWPLIRIPHEFRGVKLEGPKSIKKLIATPVILTAPEIEELTRLIASRLPAK